MWFSGHVTECHCQPLLIYVPFSNGGHPDMWLSELVIYISVKSKSLKTNLPSEASFVVPSYTVGGNVD
jgi:hypothetical protein